MEERQAKQIYEQLRSYFRSSPTIPNFQQQFQQTIEELVSLMETFEENRAQLCEKFKVDLNEALMKYQQERLQRGVEQIEKNHRENVENWSEVEPRMEAIAQIKSIFKSTFARRKAPEK